MTMTEQEILSGLGEILDEIAEVPANQVTSDKSFVDDLGIDSLSMIEIAVAAQDRFNVDIPDDELKNLKTVQDVVLFLQRSGVSALRAEIKARLCCIRRDDAGLRRSAADLGRARAGGRRRGLRVRAD